MTPSHNRTLYPFDVLIIGYSLLMAAACALLGRPVNEYFDEIIWYLSLAAVTALIVRFTSADRPGWQRFIRLLYPVLMVGVFYRLTGGTMHLLFDGFLDQQLIAFERAVFGGSPTLLLDRSPLNVWITEILSACYFSYYLFLPGFFLPVFFLQRDDIIERAMLGVLLTYFLSYLLFWLYPVEGPRWVFAEQYTQRVTGPVFRPMVEWVIANGAVRGGAMPSSHTGVALIVTLYTWRYFGRAAWPLVPVVIGLALGTVWGRYHYISDVVVGSALALIAFWFEKWYYQRHDAGNRMKRATTTLQAADVT